MSKKMIIIMALGMVVVAVVAAWILLSVNTSKTYKGEVVSFEYPQEFKQSKQVARPTKHARTLARFVQEKPIAVIELNQETGAIIGANMSKSNFLDTLEKNANKSFPISFQKYHKLGDERLKIGGRDAARLDFRYLGKDNKTTLYMSVFIIPHNNDAFYMYAQAADQRIWQSVSDKIESTVRVRS